MVDSVRSNSEPPDIGGMYTLRVDNISCHTAAGDLLAVFRGYGTVGDIHLQRFLQPGTPVCFAFVRYYSRWSAEEALFRVDGNLVLDGRQLRVERDPFGWPEPEQPHRPRSFDYASHRRGDTGGGSRRSPSPCQQRHHGRSPRNDREKPRKFPSPCRQRHHGRSRINNWEEPRPRRRRARSGSHSHAPHADDGRGGSGQSSGCMSRSRCRSPYSSPDAARQVYFRSRSRSPARSPGSPLHSSPQRSPGGARQRSYSRSRSLLRLVERSLFINIHYR